MPILSQTAAEIQAGMAGAEAAAMVDGVVGEAAAGEAIVEEDAEEIVEAAAAAAVEEEEAVVL
jgi:hypothetical protein